MYIGIVFTKDPKLGSQLDSWCRQQLAGHLRIESYPNLAAYKEMLKVASAAKLSNESKGSADGGGSAGGVNADANAQIRIFIIDAEVMDQKPEPWINELHQVTKEMGSGLFTVQPSVLMMGYETGPLRPQVMQVEAVDDLILKPVDKAVFLQKVEFLTADAGGKVTPSFLFRAKAEQVIEAGRDVIVDEVSEFAIAIRSPGPVPEGAFASIHCDVFGERGARRLIGRVYESVRHPIREGEYLVRFAYFGISAEQLNTVRRYIKNNQMAVRSKVWGATSVSAAGANSAGAASGSAAAQASLNKMGRPALSKQMQEKMSTLNSKKLAVIDLNIDELSALRGILESSFKNVTVKAFPSYARFAGELQKLLKPTGSSEFMAKAPSHQQAGASTSSGPALPGGKNVAVILRGKSHDLVKFDPELRPVDLVMGKPVSEWVSKPDQFITSIEKDDREAFEEFLTFLEAGSRGQAVIRIRGLGERSAFFSVSGQLERVATGDSPALLRVNLQEIDSDQWAKAIISSGGSPVSAKDLAEFRFDSLLIDGTFLRPDPVTWYKQFVDLLRSTKVIGPTEMGPKIFVYSDPKGGARIDSFRFKEIYDFSYKPVDRRFMVMKYLAFTPGLLPIRDPDAPPFVPCEMNAQLGKDVTMDELAEYGLSILHPTAFKDKSFMRFFSTLFGEDGAWISGKCHSCVKNLDVEIYRCQFMFFGPNDELLRRIRSWIREDYVAKKDTRG